MRCLSYSQVKTFINDPLTWVMQSLEHVRQQNTKALTFGSAFAYSIESIITEQAYPTVGKYGHKVPYDDKAMELARLWHEDNKEWLIKDDWISEYEFEVKLAPNLPKFIGAMDLYLPGDMPWIIDFKTVSHTVKPSKKFWGLKDDDLPKDLQLMLYAYQACLDAGIDINKQNGDAVVCKIGHEQIVKVKEGGQYKEVYENGRKVKVRLEPKIVDYYLTKAKNYATIDNIREALGILTKAAREMVAVEEVWKEEGIGPLVDIYGPNKKRWMFGKKCPYLDYIFGKETLEELKKRFKNV